MAKVVNFKKYEITGDFIKSNNTLLRYPYLYMLNGYTLYRLNVITKESETLAVIDMNGLIISGTTPDVIGSCMSVDTNRLYFYAIDRQSNYYWVVALCELNIDDYTVRNLGQLTAVDNYSDFLRIKSKVVQIDSENILIYQYYYLI